MGSVSTTNQTKLISQAAFKSSVSKKKIVIDEDAAIRYNRELMQNIIHRKIEKNKTFKELRFYVAGVPTN
jgi:hypothetical protein